jgi:hypothetical protein
MGFFRIGAAAGILLLAGSAGHAATDAYSINLGPVARTNATHFTAVGRGSADAALDGKTLTITGKFSGLISPATDAHLCVGGGIGVEGDCTGGPSLTVTRDTKGDLSGTIALNSQQMAALPQGRLYVQINSEKAPAPAGNLWGWILAAHETVGQDVPQQGHWFLPQYDMPKSAEHGSTHPLAGEKNS